MPDRILLDDTTCPRCDSPLASIDLDASDDRERGGEFRRLAGTARLIGLFTLFVIPFSLLYLLELRATEATTLQWIDALTKVGFVTILTVALIRAVILAWRHLHRDRSRRLATCLDCGHRWRTPGRPISRRAGRSD